MATKTQIDEALAFNQGNPFAQGLAQPLRDLLGAPPGEGYAAEMIEPIMELQASFGLGPDGKVGEGTAKALQRQEYLAGDVCSALWAPESFTPAERREHYLRLFMLAQGAPGRGGPRLLGLRGSYPFARRAHRMIHARRFDDAFVLITDADAVVFRGATHAYQLSFATSTGAVASIRPGRYQLDLAGSNPPIFNLTLPDGTGHIPAFRDNDHNGVISESEAKSAETSGAFATEIQFHPGYDTFKKPGEKFSSIGCQTAPLAELELLLHAGNSIDYALANASELASMLGSAPSGNVA